jgi:uncharacterized protein (DUF111 family)
VEERAESAGHRSEVAVLECTLDDATPQEVAFAAQRMADAGALDVFTTAVQMKKGRMGHHLTVLCRPEGATALARLLFLGTSTLGLRFRIDRRLELDREVVQVETRYGAVGVKVGRLDGSPVQIWPEYESCAELARRHDVRLAEVQRVAIEAYHRDPRTAEGGEAE